MDLITLLPKNYLRFLENKKETATIICDGREFVLCSLSVLSESSNVDNHIFPRVFILKGYFKTLQEIGFEFSSQEKKLFENALAIGDENGDILFIDQTKTNSSLYIFYPDGGDIKKTKLKIQDII